MKHTRLFISIAVLALALVVSGKAFAEGMDFSIDKSFVKPGETATLTVKLTNAEKITAITGAITLPEGLSFMPKVKTDGTIDETEYACGKAERSKNALAAMLVVRKSTPKTAGFALAYMNGLAAGSGELFTFDVKADETFAARDSIELSELLGSIIKTSGSTETIDYTQADFKTPVFNQNFKIEPTQIKVDDFTIAPGEKKMINFDFSFDKDELAALSYDLILPEGLSIVRGEDGEWPYVWTDRTPNHLVATNGTHVAIVPNPLSGESLLFAGTEGTLFTFEITADEAFAADGEITFYNFVTNTPSVNQQVTSYYAPDWTVKVTKGGTTGIDGINDGAFSADQRPDGIYSITGYKTDKLMKGINIVVKDGKAKKVVIK